MHGKKWRIIRKSAAENSATSSFGADVLEDVATCDIGLATDDGIHQKYYRDSAGAVTDRDKLFNDLLEAFCDDYKKRSKEKRSMKKWFCGSILSVFAILLLSVIILPVILVWSGSFNTITFITSMAASVSGVISAVLALPKVIAEYLFDPKEDENFLELIKNMQEYNTLSHERLEHHTNSKS